MSKLEQTEATEVTTVSTQRNITATVVSTVVTVALGAVASHFIAKIGTKVHETIAPKTETE